MRTEGWIDAQILTAVDSAELLGMLADPLIQGGWQDGGIIHFYWLKTQWTIEARSHLNRVLRQLDPGASLESDIWVEELPDQDWNRTWAESMRPLRVGRRIIIRPKLGDRIT